jgi:hypothetical protein
MGAKFQPYSDLDAYTALLSPFMCFVFLNVK